MKLFVCLAALCCIVLILSDQYQPSTALRKKRIFKKLRDLLPLLLALKGKKKILVLPLPIPFKIGKHVRQQPTWPAPAPAPAWPAPSHQISWPSSNIDLSSESWPPMPSHYQSSPPTKITHTYLPADYVSSSYGSGMSDQSVKQGIEQYLTTYTVKDGPGVNYELKGNNGGYNSAAMSSSYGPSMPGNYGRPQYTELIESRRPLPPRAPPMNKSPDRKPMFGQPLVIDEYENGKGSAPAYNDISNAPSSGKSGYVEKNRVQFKNGVSADYAGGSSAAMDNGGEYKSQNEINYEDNRLKSVSADYAGNQGDAMNEAGFEENNELVNDNVKEVPYSSNQVPAVRIPGYKKKAKV